MGSVSVVDRLAELEREVATLRASVQRSGERQAIFDTLPPIRWARTSTASEEYPGAVDEPNTYPIVFLDVEVDATAGQHTPSVTARQTEPRDVVTNLADGRSGGTAGIDFYIPLSTVIPVWRHRNRWFTYWTAPNIFPVALTGSVAANATIDVELPDGRVVSARNQTTATLITRASAYQSQASKLWYITGAPAGSGGSGGQFFYAPLPSDLAETDGSKSIPLGLTNWLDGSTTGAVTVDNLHAWRGKTGDPMLVMEAPWSPNGYLLVEVLERRVRLFRGLLNGDLASADASATVDNIVALDGFAAPTITSATNRYRLDGLDNAACFLTLDYSDLDESDNPKALLVQVWQDHHMIGKADSAIAAGASGTISIWTGTPLSESDSSNNVTGYNRTGTNIASGAWVKLERIDGFYYVSWLGEGPFLGKTDSSINKGASGTVSIWAGTPGSESDTTVNVTAYNRFSNVGSSKWVWVASNSNGFYLIAVECPPT